MTYSYDRRRVGSNETMLRLIVEKALAGRSFESLVNAYAEEMLEDLEEDREEVPPGETSAVGPWLKKHGILTVRNDIERRYVDTYVAYYRRLARASESQAKEVLDMPSRILEIASVPVAVIDAIASTQARQDADDAIALRELALQRQA
jgi:hypothetical protein